jgi:uncharacterized membrane protein YhaH (DUF805 family)
MTAKETLFGFRGRIARYTFFICALVTIPLYPIAVFGFLIGAFTAHAGSIGGAAIGAIMVAAGGVGAPWIGIALMVKRLHDIGLSGLHAAWIAVLLASLPWFAETDLGWTLVVAAIAAVAWLLLTRGQGDANAYGPVPV